MIRISVLLASPWSVLRHEDSGASDLGGIGGYGGPAHGWKKGALGRGP